MLLVKALFLSAIRDWLCRCQRRVVFRPVNLAVLLFWADDSGEMRGVGGMQQLD